METVKTWSNQQLAIFETFKTDPKNTVVRARAGTGKTTTIIEGIKFAPEISIMLCAFNKRIQKELALRLQNPRAEAKTLHAIGFNFVRKAWGRVEVNTHGDRAEECAKNGVIKLLESEGKKIVFRNDEAVAPEEVLDLVEKIATRGKDICPLTLESDQLRDIAIDFDLMPDAETEARGWSLERICKAAYFAMELACVRGPEIGFEDMVFIALRGRLACANYDLVVVDEAQDMSPAQLLLAQRICRPKGRIIVVGDDKQAIYGFRGADSNSIDRLKSELQANELGLTTTYRCPKKIVARAQRLVPDFHAAPEAPDGVIESCAAQAVTLLANVGDFILSRTNAPLVPVCMALLRAGKRARVEGRDIGKGLKAILKRLRMKDRTIVALLKALSEWEKDQIERVTAKMRNKKAREAKILSVRDQAATIAALTADLENPQDVDKRIDELFADDETAGPRIVCSTVHKAKGLEADTVFLLMETFYPGGRRDDPEEKNIEYVAITRSKRRLILVGESDSNYGSDD